MPARRFSPARDWPLLVLATASLLLIVSEFLTLREIKAITAVIETKTAGAHHGYALLVIGLGLAVLAWGAVIGGSRPAAVAVLALSVAALVIVFAVDAPKVTAEGITAERYEEAKASPKIGFYLESAGAVLALVGAVSLFLLPVSREKQGHATRRSQEGHEEGPPVRAHQEERQGAGEVGVDG